jgi:protein involved in polysaccharide export with SLBB domain
VTPSANVTATEGTKNEPSRVSPDAPEAPVAPPPASSASAAGDIPAGDGDVTIQPDCLLQIRVEEDSALDGSYTVNDIGAIQFGYVGPVMLQNRTEEQAALKIREVLGKRDFRKATVKVRLLRASYDKVQVSGDVQRPSMIRIGAGDSISLSEALLRAGGIRSNARNCVAQIIRGGIISPVPYALEREEYKLVDGDGKATIPEILLRNNDMLDIVSKQQAPGGNAATGGQAAGGGVEVIVLGEVSRPGVVRFGAGEPCSMMHLMFKLGPLPLYANKKAVKILRRDPTGLEREIKVNVERLLDNGSPEDDVPLQDGDRIRVPARRLTLF